MPRLFFSNFDFEATLATPQSLTATTSSGQHRGGPSRLLAELAFAWLAIAEPEDVIVTPTPPVESPRQFLEASLGRVLPTFARTPADLQRSPKSVADMLTALPWGWSPGVEQQAATWGAVIPDHPAPSIVRLANSRRFSSSLEQEFQCGLAGAMTIFTRGDLDRFLATFRHDTHQHAQCDDGLEPVRRWVLKSDLSHSARERILGTGPELTESQQRWVERRLERGGPLAAEPWVERIAEAGVQWEIPRDGEPVLVGIVPLLTGAGGEYRGSYLDSETVEDSGGGSASPPDLFSWNDPIPLQRQAVLRLQTLGYFGPCGIDACWYRDADGATRLRPLQDINARWTMGRLALGWRRMLAPGDRALWTFGQGSDSPTDPQHRDRPFPASCTIATSPTALNGSPMQLPSRLLIARKPSDR